MSNERLTFVALNVSSLANSLHFYGGILGIPLAEISHDAEKRDPWYGGNHASYSWTDGAYLHFALYPAQEPLRPISTATQIGFHVADFEATHQRVVESGFEVIQTPRSEPWGLTARYLDPDGNIVSITQA
jgi:predicted enzyme related to lactoylglutathione lyase